VKDEVKSCWFPFPVGRIYHLLCKGNYNERVDATAPICLAAVMEYLAYGCRHYFGNFIFPDVVLSG